MNRRRLNRLCDRTLKALNSGKFKSPIKYEINEIDDTVKVTDDFFKKIKIQIQEIPFVITALLKNDFIKVFTSGGRSKYSDSRKIHLNHDVFEIKIKDAGVLFINSSSFRLESLKGAITKWIPLSIAAISLLVTVAFNYVSCNRQSKQEEINKKGQDLEGRFDSLLRTFPVKKIPADTSTSTVLKK